MLWLKIVPTRMFLKILILELSKNLYFVFYFFQTKTWRKWKKPPATGPVPRSAPPTSPGGRRGHSAVMAGNKMIIYGGFQDLRGSTNEMWAFNVGW